MLLKLKEKRTSTKHNRLKNPNWREADQLAIYKRDQGVEQGRTRKQLQLSGQNSTWTCDLQISRTFGALTTLPRFLPCKTGQGDTYFLVCQCDLGY